MSSRTNPFESPTKMSDSQQRVVMYRTRGCPFCVMAEQLLQQKSIPVEQIYLDDHPDRRGFVSSILPGHYTVPLVLIDDRAIGGFTELQDLDAGGELENLTG